MDNQQSVTFTPQELNLVIDSLGRNFSRLMTLRDGGRNEPPVLSKEMQDLRDLHLRLVKLKRAIPRESS